MLHIQLHTLTRSHDASHAASHHYTFIRCFTCSSTPSHVHTILYIQLHTITRSHDASHAAPHHHTFTRCFTCISTPSHAHTMLHMQLHTITRSHDASHAATHPHTFTRCFTCSCTPSHHIKAYIADGSTLVSLLMSWCAQFSKMVKKKIQARGAKNCSRKKNFHLQNLRNVGIFHR